MSLFCTRQIRSEKKNNFLVSEETILFPLFKLKLSMTFKYFLFLFHFQTVFFLSISIAGDQFVSEWQNVSNYVSYIYVLIRYAVQHTAYTISYENFFFVFIFFFRLIFLSFETSLFWLDCDFEVIMSKA